MAKAPVKYYVVDAFTDSAFKGNPAAVCLLEEERDEKWLQAVAAEFNISETCYLTRITDSASPYPRFRLRWFTPVAEVNLCGHATLASANTLFSTGLVNSNIIEFDTLSGILTAKKVSDSNPTDVSKIQNGGHDCFLIELNFPAVPITEFNSTEVSAISKALNGAQLIDVKRTTTADDLFVVLPSAKSVIELEPQFDAILNCPGRGIIVSGVSPPDSEFDFSSRFFCPKYGINEDPVCGSAHCALVKYWSQKLGKCDFVAHAASPRGGIVKVHLDEQNDRVFLRGKAVTVMEGCLLV
ncbi:Phenazine biosynthesis PhzF protein [Corchorus olitorius]|uniref:Phenazine biosynthesis PhzF protein n=1 Tax=Corchorus olitorius TaxID=93759 RepID=A0A1R3KD89_9ROSI|nr:Phenazine biosynthesis PhzF protein [Corchorus olitorius]